MSLTWALIDRYLAGECNPAEISYVRSILDQVPEYEALLIELRSGVSLPAPHEFDVPEGMTQLRAMLTIAEPRLDSARFAKTPPATRRSLWHRAPARTRIWGTVGMAFAIITVAFTAVPGLRAVLRPPRRIVASRMYTTARGEWTAVTLTDSSRVVLAPETRLRYVIDNRDARSVELLGEAYFTVTASPRSPFIVQTGNVTTTVLGTAFDIRHYADDRSVQIAVKSGRVAAGGRLTPVVLMAGSVAHVTDSSVVLSPDGNVDGLTSWTQGHLIFHDAQVSTMLSTLGRWSGYEFRLTDSALATTHVSIGFNADQPEALLQTLKAVLGVTMTFEGNVITLRPERDGGSAPRGAPIREVQKHPEPEVGK